MCVGSLSEREESVPVPSELKYCKHNLWWLTLRFFHSIMEFNFKLWIVLPFLQLSVRDKDQLFIFV